MSSSPGRRPVSVEVIEPQMADRVRRASDVYLALGYAVLAALAITLGNLALGTADALEQDLALATGGLPRLLLQLFSWVAGVGVLILPIGVGIDHPAFDLNGDGIADSFYRPNDLMDQILWSQPAASLLIGSPAVQLVRWSQRDFPATLPGGVRDSAPLMQPLTIPVPPEILAYEAEVAGRWVEGNYDDTDTDNLSAH